MKILFATHNLGKVKEFKIILKGIAEIEHLNIEYEEIQSDDPEEVARLSAENLANKLGKTIIVEDSGLFIDALNGFPGVYSAPIYHQIGLKGIITLMQNEKNRQCEYRSAVGYCEPGKKPKSFLGVEKGMIAESLRGEYGFGHDPIFIPLGKTKTYGETKNAEEEKKFRRRAIEKLMRYLHEH